PEAWPEVDLPAAAAAASATNGNGHGNGAISDGLDSWAGVGESVDDGIEDIDPAARLAFLSGEVPLAAVEPDSSFASRPAWPTADEIATAQAAPPDEPALAEEPASEAAIDQN